MSDDRYTELARTHWPTEPRFVCSEDPRAYEGVVVQLRRGHAWRCLEGATLYRGALSHPLLGGAARAEELGKHALVWRRREKGAGSAVEVEALVAYATHPIVYYDFPIRHCTLPACLLPAEPHPRIAQLALWDDGEVHRPVVTYAESSALEEAPRARPPAPLTTRGVLADC